MLEFLLLVFVIAIYFIPSLIASMRCHPAAGVFLVNLFLGWTLIGWFIALGMACTAKRRRRGRIRS